MDDYGERIVSTESNHQDEWQTNIPQIISTSTISPTQNQQQQILPQIPPTFPPTLSRHPNDITMDSFAPSIANFPNSSTNNGLVYDFQKAQQHHQLEQQCLHHMHQAAQFNQPHISMMNSPKNDCRSDGSSAMIHDPSTATRNFLSPTKLLENFHISKLHGSTDKNGIALDFWSDAMLQRNIFHHQIAPPLSVAAVAAAAAVSVQNSMNTSSHRTVNTNYFLQQEALRQFFEHNSPSISNPPPLEIITSSALDNSEISSSNVSLYEGLIKPEAIHSKSSFDSDSGSINLSINRLNSTDSSSSLSSSTTTSGLSSNELKLDDDESIVGKKDFIFGGDGEHRPIISSYDDERKSSSAQSDLGSDHDNIDQPQEIDSIHVMEKYTESQKSADIINMPISCSQVGTDDKNNSKTKSKRRGSNGRAVLCYGPSCSKPDTYDIARSTAELICSENSILIDSIRATLKQNGLNYGEVGDVSIQQSSGSSFLRAPGLGPSSSPDVKSISSPLFRCDICGFSCQSKFHYNSHMNTHSDHQCTMCDYTSRTEGRLKKHMRDSHTIEEQLAAGMDIDTSHLSNTSTAQSSHGAGTVSSISSVLEAAVQYAASNDIPMELCKDMQAKVKREISSDSTNLSYVHASESGTSALDHIQALTENSGILACLSDQHIAVLSKAIYHPNSTAPNSSELTRSSGSGTERRASGKPKSYTCKQCSHISASKEEQWMHSRTHIPREKQLNCNLCGFVTEYKHHLEYHVRNHSGAKPFQCTKCAYQCVNKSMLNSHMKSHTNVYQYRCRDCSYATKYCHSLKLHLRKYAHVRREGAIGEPLLPNGGSQGDRLTEASPNENEPDALTTNVPSTSLGTNQLLFGSITEASPLSNMTSQMFCGSNPGILNPLLFQKNVASANDGQVFPCSLCGYLPSSHAELYQHQMTHILGSDLSSLCSSLIFNTNDCHVNGDMLEEKNRENDEDNECEGNLSDFDQDSHDEIQKEQESRDSPDSKESAEKFNGTDDAVNSDVTPQQVPKESRKRKAALNLNRIADRLKVVKKTLDNHQLQKDVENAIQSNSILQSLMNGPTTSLNASVSEQLVSTLTLNAGIEMNWIREVCMKQIQEIQQQNQNMFNNLSFTCSHCHIQFSDQVLYNLHMGFHGFENAFKCNRCGHVCDSSITFNLHLLEAKH